MSRRGSFSALLVAAWMVAVVPASADAARDEAEVSSSEAESTSACGRGDEAPEVWIDRMQWGLYRGVCESAEWIDHFFASESYELDETEGTYGRVGLGLGWDDYDGFDADIDAKVRLALPRLERRLDVFVGRYQEDELIEGRSDDFSGVPLPFRSASDQAWLAGLGYHAVRSARDRLDFDAGVDLDFPVDPFVRARYRRYLFVDERSLVRLQQTVFWRRERDWGTTSRVDVERTLSLRRHLRWRGVVTVDEETQGVDWSTAVTLYQYLGERRAMAFEWRADGETDAPVTLEAHSLQAIYRLGKYRDWLFFEIRGRVFWPRDIGETERDAAWGIGLGVEALFGEHPWLRRPRP